ncbi:hypothetical protein [Paraburkholderia azotifigens]|uniref:Recombinase RecA n=1 Tax=Paraburkholderia azotifigens TaxID=2057004 RepID=A0ABU9QTD9_9BURK|nr:hypothetical protein [Paraburkholderia azotifigens]
MTAPIEECQLHGDPSETSVPVDRVMLVKAANSADALWSVEQMLRAGTCSAVIFWAQHVKDSSRRRLHLAAQSTESLFIVVRPLATAQDSSPATLRLALRPTCDGLVIDIVKGRGPALAGPIPVTLQPTPVLFSNRGRAAKPAREGADHIVSALERAHA